MTKPTLASPDKKPLVIPQLSIIIPVLNEARLLPSLLETLLQLQRQSDIEIIIVDGGSDDGTPQLVELMGFRLLRSKQGRAAQMNAGAALARGTVLLFLHADTVLPNGADQLIANLEAFVAGNPEHVVN